MNIIIEALEALVRKLKIAHAKRNYEIRKQGDRWHIFFCGGALDRYGFPTKKAARQRLREYFCNVNWNF